MVKTKIPAWDYFIYFHEMITLIYHFLWTLIFAFCAPIGLLLRNRRLLDRLALKLPQHSLGRNNIWIHALSVGEVISAVPLVKALSQKYPNKIDGNEISYYVGSKVSPLGRKALIESFQRGNDFTVFEKLEKNKWRNLGLYKVKTYNREKEKVLLFKLVKSR